METLNNMARHEIAISILAQPGFHEVIDQGAYFSRLSRAHSGGQIDPGVGERLGSRAATPHQTAADGNAYFACGNKLLALLAGSHGDHLLGFVKAYPGGDFRLAAERCQMKGGDLGIGVAVGEQVNTLDVVTFTEL